LDIPKTKADLEGLKSKYKYVEHPQ
jgi:hypothetical protein